MSYLIELKDKTIHDIKREEIVSKKDPSKVYQKVTVTIYDAFVNEHGYEYEKYIPVTFFGTNADRVNDGYKMGDKVTIKADLGGRAWNDKYFLELSGWFIRKNSVAGAQEAEVAAPDEIANEQDSDELPF